MHYANVVAKRQAQNALCQSKLLESEKDDAKVADQLSWNFLYRAPTPAELERCTTLLGSGSEKDRRKGAEDLAWALLNSKEFVFRQ